MRRKILDRKKRERRRQRALRENAKAWLRHMDRRTTPEPRTQPGTGGIPDALDQERTA